MGSQTVLLGVEGSASGWECQFGSCCIAGKHWNKYLGVVEAKSEGPHSWRSAGCWGACRGS